MTANFQMPNFHRTEPGRETDDYKTQWSLFELPEQRPPRSQLPFKEELPKLTTAINDTTLFFIKTSR